MIVLDTHAWVWWVNDPRELSSRAREAIEDASQSGDISVSSISAWEVSLLARKGRLELTMEVEDWVAGCEVLPFLSFVPVDNRIAMRSTRLEGFESQDPADRIIVATAISLGARLVTRDAVMRRWKEVKTVW